MDKGGRGVPRPHMGLDIILMMHTHVDELKLITPHKIICCSLFSCCLNGTFVHL